MSSKLLCPKGMMVRGWDAPAERGLRDLPPLPEAALDGRTPEAKGLLVLRPVIQELLQASDVRGEVGLEAEPQHRPGVEEDHGWIFFASPLELQVQVDDAALPVPGVTYPADDLVTGDRPLQPGPRDGAASKDLLDG